MTATIHERPTLPGQSSGPAASRDPVILRADTLTKLGRALGTAWYAWDGHELRVMGVAAQPGDTPQPNTVLIHARVHHPAGMVEVPGPDEWSPSKRARVEAWDEDAYYRATIHEAGAFEAAQRTDAARQSRGAKLADPEHRAAKAERLERSKARQRWLAGYSDVDPALLGLDE